MIKNLYCTCFGNGHCEHEVAVLLQLKETLDIIDRKYREQYECTGYFAAITKGTLFDNAVVKSLYLTGVYEYDFTYAGEQTSKLAAEIGWRLEYQVREGVKLSTNGYYREYLSYSE